MSVLVSTLDTPSHITQQPPQTTLLTMKIPRDAATRLTILSLIVTPACAFVGLHPTVATTRTFTSSRLYADTSTVKTSSEPPVVKTKTLGLVTFDLDDTLYPIAPVIKEANAAFAKAMSTYGFPNIEPEEIDLIGRQIREEVAQSQGAGAASMITHTEIRTMAIRREMEEVILERKLQAAAEDWATPVSSLSNIVVSHARKWARTAVSESIVQAVLNAWEMERHHAAERHVYPGLVDVLKQIKAEHPGVIFGAVTDGHANPLFMTFTLAPFFDFCMSWEDDQGGRSKFFKELNSVEGTAELKWIYNAAVEKYQELAAVQAALGKDPVDPNKEWIHIGDDLAYDVGGAAQCGAKTILLELADKYGQTARHRFEDIKKQPSWSTTSRIELEKRKLLNEAAKDKVDRTVAFLGLIPEAINEILSGEEARHEA